MPKLAQNRLMVITLATVLTGAIAGLAGWLVAHQHKQEYVAEAVYRVQRRSPDVEFVSHSKTIVAEQTARQLQDGPTTSGSADTQWVTGSSYGEVIFRVHAPTQGAATRQATEIFELPIAELFPTDERPAAMTAREVRPGKAVYADATTVIGAAVAAGAALGCAAATSWGFRRKPASA